MCISFCKTSKLSQTSEIYCSWLQTEGSNHFGLVFFRWSQSDRFGVRSLCMVLQNWVNTDVFYTNETSPNNSFSRCHYLDHKNPTHPQNPTFFCTLWTYLVNVLDTVTKLHWCNHTWYWLMLKPIPFYRPKTEDVHDIRHLYIRQIFYLILYKVANVWPIDILLLLWNCTLLRVWMGFTCKIEINGQ